jgi:hypothetical protein
MNTTLEPLLKKRFGIYRDGTPSEQQVDIMKDLIEGKTCALAISKEQHDALKDSNLHEYPEDFLKILNEERELRAPKGYDTLIQVSKQVLKPYRFLNPNVVEVPMGHMEAHSNPKKKIERLLHGVRDHVVVAGGCAVSMMLDEYELPGIGGRLKDVDLFVHSCAEDEADLVVSKILWNASCIDKPFEECIIPPSKILAHVVSEQDLWKHKNFKKLRQSEIPFPNTMVLPNCISFVFDGLKIQIIKRLYSSPAEVIVGFDVDSCCVLYDYNTEKYWITPRGLYAFNSRTNFVDFTRMSPTYETRLIKYASLGFNIFVPHYGYLNSQCQTDPRWKKKNNNNQTLVMYLLKLRTEMLSSERVIRKKLQVAPALKLLWIALGLFNKTDYSHAVYGSDDELRKQIQNSDYSAATPDSIIWLSSQIVHHVVSNHSPKQYNFRFTWKTLNPGEQIINTFHRTILEDFRTWYDLKWELVDFVPSTETKKRPMIGDFFFSVEDINERDESDEEYESDEEEDESDEDENDTDEAKSAKRKAPSFLWVFANKKRVKY